MELSWIKFKAIIHHMYISILLKLNRIRMWFIMQIMHLLAIITKDTQAMNMYKVMYYRFTHH